MNSKLFFVVVVCCINQLAVFGEPIYALVTQNPNLKYIISQRALQRPVVPENKTEANKTAEQTPETGSTNAAVNPVPAQNSSVKPDASKVNEEINGKTDSQEVNPSTIPAVTNATKNETSVTPPIPPTSIIPTQSTTEPTKAPTPPTKPTDPPKPITTVIPTKKPNPETTFKPAEPTSSTESPHKGRHFDGPSFIGGIVLAAGLMAISFVAFKFYKARNERNYHTL